jgi:hypothetical protein
VCLCISVIEIQTVGPISIKFGTFEDQEWFLCIFEKIKLCRVLQLVENKDNSFLILMNDQMRKQID